VEMIVTVTVVVDDGVAVVAIVLMIEGRGRV
jgi:hypothetical protein